MIAAIHRYPAGLHQPRHAHPTMGVTLVLAGSLHERVGRVDEIAVPLSLVIKPVGVEHEDHFGPGVRTLQLQFHEKEAAGLTRVHRSMRHWRWIHSGASVRPFLALARALAAQDQPAAELAAVDALASVDFPEPLRGSPPPEVTRVKQRLDQDPRPTRMCELAREAGMHPVYLARLFRRSFGTSMGQYLRRRRIRVVIGRLGGGGSLSTVAHETGFADHPHMCRAFRAETGMTPSAYELLLAPREVSSVQDPAATGVQIVAGTGSEVTCAPVSPGRYRPCC